jgi:hypothetical protein
MHIYVASQQRIACGNTQMDAWIIRDDSSSHMPVGTLCSSCVCAVRRLTRRPPETETQGGGQQQVPLIGRTRAAAAGVGAGIKAKASPV